MRATRRELLAQLGDVAHDLPAFLTAPLYRRWHRHWGATPAEATAPLPGDALLPQAQFRSTRAITIHAPLAAVWPWLVHGRLVRARQLAALDQARQHLGVAVDRHRRQPDPTGRPASTPPTTGDTRCQHFFGLLLMEFGDFAMQRRMLRGIKTRAESLARQTETPRPAILT